jgi:hypothetical protein
MSKLDIKTSLIHEAKSTVPVNSHLGAIEIEANLLAPRHLSLKIVVGSSYKFSDSSSFR